MTPFFDRMAARAVGTEPTLRVRIPEPFEPAAPPTRIAHPLPPAAAPSLIPSEAEDFSDEHAPKDDHDRRSAADRTSGGREVRHLPADGVPAEVTPARDRPARPEPDRSAAREAAAGPRPGVGALQPRHLAASARGAEAGPAAADVDRPVVDRSVGHSPAEPPRTPQPRVEHARPAPTVTAEPQAGPSLARGRRRLRVQSRSAAAPSPDPVARPTEAVPAHDVQREVAPASRPAATAQPARAADLDLAALLRDHIVPALVDRGEVDGRERPLVVPPGSGGPAPRPGNLTVSAGRADVRGGQRSAPGAAPAQPEVHVHIDRVVVTRAAVPQPAPPPAPRQVDHAAYLARRRERS